MAKHSLFVFSILVAFFATTSANNNYGQQAKSISYEKKELPAFGTLNGTVTELDLISSEIKLNRTKAFLNCSAGFMNIKLNFERPFFGLIYADYDRNSACKVFGNGKLTEKIELPLRGCGTLQVGILKSNVMKFNIKNNATFIFAETGKSFYKQYYCSISSRPRN